MAESRVSGWAGAVALAVGAGLLGAGFYGYAFDDPFITYRVASNLADGLGMVYNPGERVNALTSPLHGILLAGLHLVTGLDFPVLGAALTMIGLFAACLMIMLLLRRTGLPAFPTAALVLFQPLLIQTMGMETGLLLGLGVGAVYTYSRERFTLTGALLGLAILTRPDAALLAAIIAAHFIITRKKLPPLLSGVALVAAVGPWEIFSVVYFGELLPHTLAVKEAQRAVPGQWGGPWMFARTLARLGIDFVGELDLTGLMAAGCLAVGIVTIIKGKEGAGGTPAPQFILLLIVWGVLHGLAYALVLRVPPYTWYFAPVVVVLALVGGIGAVSLARLDVVKWRYFVMAVAGGLLLWAVGSVPGMGWGRRFSPIHAGHALGYAALVIVAVAGWSRRKSPGVREAPVLAMIILLGSFGPRVWNGFLPMTHLPTTQQKYYASAAQWIKSERPGVQTVGAHEIGVLGYELMDRTIIDQCGIPTPGAAEAMASGDMTWWVRKYRPGLLVLHADRHWWEAVEGPLLDASWFRSAYSSATTIGGPGDKHAVEIWELVEPSRVPSAVLSP